MLETLANVMNALPAGTASTIGTWVAALLTLAVLSFIFGENPAFRLAEYLFVGIAAGYAGALAWTQVLWPRAKLFLANPQAYWYYGLFFALGLLLLTRGVRSLSTLGNLPLGVLFGTGAGLALGGALTGSLVPQIEASVVSLSPADYGQGLVGWAYAIDAFILLIGTIAVLSAFHFTGKGQGAWSGFWHGLLRILQGAGRGFIMVAFGALLAGATLSFFAALQSRLAFLLRDWIKLFGNMGL
ncbi:MAG: hypothetical protein J7M05_06315 [Anaerolineae bacterium]|nr:hypothetical protein [Anaerolineae bacterium]